MRGWRVWCLAALAGLTIGASVRAAEYPAPKEGDWVARDFRFHTGEVMPALKIHYATVGDPKGEPVLVLHGTAGSGASMLTKDFAGELFGPGQPLDATKYFVILPDAIGAGKSSKPSDGLRARFPRYDYTDMVEAQYRLVTEGLGLKRLRLVLGNSMGGMHAWLWATTYPEIADAVVPMASQPTAMASRNWMLRRLLVEAIRNDPDYKGGDYTTTPRSLAFANVAFGIATNGGSLGYQALAPTAAKADELVTFRLSQPFTADANDYLYQWESSRDYDPSPNLERIRAAILAINSADDERNPPESGIMERELKRIPNARYHLIPASTETRGHGTTGLPRFWKEALGAWLPGVPRRAPEASR